MQHTPIQYDEVKSPFIVDRLRETDWQHHAYIADLLRLARYIERNGPHSCAEALQYRQLQAHYPTEFLALEIEQREGRSVPTEEFQRMKEEQQRKRVAEDTQRFQNEQQARREQQRSLNAAYASWRTAGGRA